MNISWTSTDAFNATLIDDASGQTLFTIQSPFSLKKQVITLSDARGQVVGEYESQLGRHDRVTYQGQTRRLSEWLTKKHWYSTYRQVHAPNGKTYMWKEHHSLSGRLKLVEEQSDASVAESHLKNLGFSSDKHNMQINASPEVVPFLELVVFSFVVCESERRMRNYAVVPAAAASD
ncbi:hypothetical protein BD311DRAFT_810665 [Dichomitus squalens]|uniref:DUF6593 domain-containing protein n=1 Tax=Dichomitus squalens TaxID=114155 RepID=A0A4Q9M956_9APHY|nr:hypothetical protein BD311DRAFT_810665 [Dichomitus squalens]